MSEMPEEYRGREQTWLKHRVLEEYLDAWAHKLGSIRSRDVHLWYVDCFAGPWESQDKDLNDTSVAIGLRALNQAAATWRSRGHRIALHAVFVEKNARSYEALRAFLAESAKAVDAQPLLGAFGDHVAAIDRMVGDAPAFIFVDPTGWNGVDLRFTATLAARPRRDVMVNVMYDHINRFKDDPRAFLRRQMRDFFGLSQERLPPGLSEEDLMGVYRRRLQELSGLRYVADLSVPVPDRNRTKFRLVVGGSHPKVIELFRDVERKVIGGEAAPIRAEARARAEEARTRQLMLLQAPAPETDPAYADQRAAAERAVREHLPERLSRGGAVTFGELWPEILCSYHLTLADLRRVAWELHMQGAIVVRGIGDRERSVKDTHVLTIALRTS